MDTSRDPDPIVLHHVLVAFGCRRMRARSTRARAWRARCQEKHTEFCIELTRTVEWVGCKLRPC